MFGFFLGFVSSRFGICLCVCVCVCALIFLVQVYELYVQLVGPANVLNGRLPVSQVISEMCSRLCCFILSHTHSYTPLSPSPPLSLACSLTGVQLVFWLNVVLF